MIGCLSIVSLFALLLSGYAKPESPDEGQKTGEGVKEKPTVQNKTAGASGNVLTNSIGMKLKLIPAGTFLMGSPDSEKDRDKNEVQHKVTLTKPFYLGVYEVTQEQYEKVMGSNPSSNVGPKMPVESSWYDAKAFCKKLSEIEKQEYRLPTEAEWEYACRAGTQTAFYWGDLFDEKFAWYEWNSGGKSKEVGTSHPNDWCLYDMSGNVSEWCEDWMADYLTGEQVDPKGAVSGEFRVIRGGSFYNGSWYNDPQQRCRSAFRDCWGPQDRSDYIGFRVVAVPAAASTPAESVPTAAEGKGELFTNSIGMQFKLIPAGSFLMGSPDSEKGRRETEGPQHKVTLTKPCYLGVYEVTQEQYEKVMGTNPSYFKRAKLPVEHVIWNDARNFCLKLSQLEKDMTYRLPTEAEWEYAARAGTPTAYYWGDEFDGLSAWCSKNSGMRTHEVGMSQPNTFGLYDMSGNVWEWCEDWFADYPMGEQVDPKGAASGSDHVFRGGCLRDVPLFCRSAIRDSAPDGYGDFGGFRVVAVPVAGR